jgi:GNAT superfamily N-acetyltransferase
MDYAVQATMKNVGLQLGSQEELMAEIRDLHKSQYPTAAQLLARAMRDDPMHEAVFGPHSQHRLRQLGRFFSTLLPLMDSTPLAAWEADQLIGIAAFFPPGTCHLSLFSQLRIACGLLSPKIAELWRLWRWLHATGQHDPKEHHWHLGPVAVDTNWQCRGIGSQMLQALCARMDERGEAAFLETDKAESVRFYGRLGFEVTAKANVFGVPNWWMNRAGKKGSCEKVAMKSGLE